MTAPLNKYMPQFHVKCNKVFKYDGTVLAYDYNVDEAVRNGYDMVFHYKDYTMTIPHDEILSKGKLNPRIFQSQFKGKHQFYKCYKFKWKQDDNSRDKTTPDGDQASYSISQQQGRLFEGKMAQG